MSVNPKPMKIDANQIRTLREARGWSQEHLASVAGLSPRTVQRMEAEGKASHESRMAVAAALGIEPRQLLEADGMPRSVAAKAGPSIQWSNLLPWVMLLALGAGWFAYQVGKDLALRGNARCEAPSASCNKQVTP